MMIVDNVLIVRASDLGWLCEVAGEPVFVGRLQVAPGAEMPPVGARDSIVLTVSGAYDLGALGRGALVDVMRALPCQVDAAFTVGRPPP